MSGSGQGGKEAADNRQRAVSQIHKTLRGLLFTETEVLYFHLASVGVGRDEILDKPDSFVKTLRDIFGNGAPLIEGAVAAQVCQELGMEPVSDLAVLLRRLAGGSNDGGGSSADGRGGRP